MVHKEAGPFEYYSDQYAGVTGDTIRADAQDPGLNASTLESLAGELEGDSKQVAQSLDGDITTAVQVNPQTASEASKVLAQKGHYAVGLINSFAGMVDTFDTEVSRINHQYRVDLASSMRWAGRAAASTESKEDDAGATEAVLGPKTKANLQPQYNAALTKLDTDADMIAVKFKQGPTDENVRDLIRQGLIPLSAAAFWPNLNLTPDDKIQYYKNTIGKMTDAEQLAWIEANKDNLPPELASVISPAVQEQIAVSVAEDIKDPENIDASTVALMTFLQKQGPFSEKLYEQVSPQQMSDAIAHLNYEIFGVGRPSDREGSEYPGPPNVELYNKFMNAAGVSLATYSRSDSVNGSDLANTWFNAITDDKHMQNAAALTLLIREGGESGGDFDPTFIDKLSSDVLKWEQGQDSPVWAPRNGADGIWIRDPDTVKVHEWTDQYGNPVYSVKDGLASDGMANLLAGMGSSPEGAQRFFTTDSGATDTERLEYLMLHRTFADSKESDEGDGLGEALQAATIGGTPGQNGTFTQMSADDLARDMFKLIADNSGTDDKDNLGTDKAGGPLDGDMDNEWHVWENMTDSLGAIGAGYADDIFRTVGPGSGSDGSLGLNEKDWLRVVGEIGHSDNKTGLETLLAGVARAGMDEQVGGPLSQFAANQNAAGQPVNMTTFTNSGINLDTAAIGDVLGTLVNASDDVYNDEAMAESKRNAYVAKAFEIGTSFIPGAGKLAPELSEAGQQVLDLGKGELISQMQSAISASPSAEDGGYRTSIRDSLRYALSNEFLQQGFLGEQPDPRNPGTSFPGVDPSILTTSETGATVFDAELFYDRTLTPNVKWDAWVGSNPYAQVGDMSNEMTNELDAVLNMERPPTQG